MDPLNAMVLVFIGGTTMLVIAINLAVHLLKKYETRPRLRFQRL